MLRVENIGYWYHNEEEYLYKDVNLNFEAGKVYGILGASGSGKTTFLSLIAGLDKPKMGTIYYKDQSIKQIGWRNYRRTSVSVIFQAYNLLPYLSAVENVISAMAISNHRHQELKKVAFQALKNVGLTEEQAKKPVVQLSGGQQQRVAIVRALCCEHDLIVADEPTGNLDEKTSQEIVSLFQEVAHKQEKCVIIVTHEQDVAAACDHIYELKKQAFHQRK